MRRPSQPSRWPAPVAALLAPIFVLAPVRALVPFSMLAPLAAQPLAARAADERAAEAGGRIPAALLPQPSMIAQLRASGLIGGDVDPVPRFSWALEVKRPARDPKRMSEVFHGSPGGADAGLSPMVRRYLPLNPEEIDRPVLSVRGLATVHPEDEALEVEVKGLRLPFAEGASFDLRWQHDGVRLEQHCTAAARVPAAALHEAMPGTARRIDCAGEGRYRGIPVGVVATVFYIERLGVFIQSESTLKTPFGPLRSSSRITRFSMP